MTDDRGHQEQMEQELMDMIERLIAGETVGAVGARDEEQEKLLALAAELSAQNAAPTAEFETGLREQLRAVETQKTQSRSAWLPKWLSVPRLAAVTAALVIGLGLVGLAGAIIRGGYQGKTTADSDSSAVSETRTSASDTQGLDKAIGQLNQSGEAVTGSSSESTTGSAGETVAPDGSGYAGSGVAGSASAASPAGSTSAPLPSTQKVIQTADYRIEVAQGEFDAKYVQLAAIASKYGGYVVSGDIRAEGDQLKRGNLTIRVLSANDNFAKAQAEIDGLGNVTSRKIAGQDVTEEYVDLQSRLRNSEAQEAQMLELMKKAETIEAILAVQSRLSDIQAQIEQIKGRIQYMDSRTDYATITVDLRETKDGGSGQTAGQEINWGFVDSLKYAGWLAVQSVNFVIVSLGIIIPVLLIGLVVFLLAYRLVRRLRNR